MLNCFVFLQLLTLSPKENSLALVYRDKETLKFVKYVNHRMSTSSESTEFYDFSVAYYEWRWQPRPVQTKHQKTLPFVELLNFFGSSVCAIAFCGLFHCDWHSTRRSGVCLSVVTEEIAILACWRGPGVRIPMAQKLFTSGFLSICSANQLSHNEYTNSTPSVWRRDGKGEDWPLAVVCWGQENEGVVVWCERLFVVRTVTVKAVWPCD